MLLSRINDPKPLNHGSAANNDRGYIADRGASIGRPQTSLLLPDDVALHYVSHIFSICSCFSLVNEFFEFLDGRTRHFVKKVLL